MNGSFDRHDPREHSPPSSGASDLEALRMLELVLDTIPVRVFWKDLDLNYLGCNRPFARDAGLDSPDELLGRNDFDMGWAEQAELYRADDRAVIESGQAKLNYEEPQTTPTGQTIWLRTSKIPLRDAAGNITGILGTYEDITEQKRTEAERQRLESQYRQAQKMESIGRLAGGLAHDFNNMLNVIIGYADLALQTLPDGHSLRSDLEAIGRAGQRSADLVRQLLAFARQQTIAPQLLDLNDAITHLLRMLERLIGEDIDLLWRPSPESATVLIDPSQLDQVLVNLVVNARDAIAGVGKVTIETTVAQVDESYCRTHVEVQPGSYVMLAVSDDGCGMASEVQAQLFEPFFSTKPPGAGTGLGLATVYGIVKQNRGFINVYSEVGCGTTFKIYLPRQGVSAQPLDHATASDAQPGVETVLLVEDEAILLDFSARLLGELGYTVLPAVGPAQALQMAADHGGDIDILLTDVVMPGMNGHDLWQRLRQERPHLKCLFTSGYTANVISHHGVLDPGIHFLPKPYTPADLAVKLREALAD
jgi:two-component system, cell cycle sensor histidine kinase and response regulator CckA